MARTTITHVPWLRRMSLRVNPNREVVVRAPMRTTEIQIQKFIDTHTAWIRKQRSNMSGFVRLTREQIRDLRDRAEKFLPRRVAELAEELDFRYQRVVCRHQKSRWGSCSHRNVISLNIELMRLPKKLRDYIIVHELTHTVHKHHQTAFWNYLERIFPWALECDEAMKDWKIGYEKRD